MNEFFSKHRYAISVVALVVGLIALYFILPAVFAQNYRLPPADKNLGLVQDKNSDTQETESRSATNTVAHQQTPEQVKGVYMSACAASSRKFRTSFLNLLEETELNSVIIDIKDYTGKISFPTEGKLAEENKGADGCRYSEMKDFIKRLHERDIYVIGRITAFQDPFYAQKNPSTAIKRKDSDGLWADKEGLHYLDPGAKKAWGYLVRIGKAGYRIGFDELNYDYIRYPSDGDVENMRFPVSEGDQKRAVLKSFFSHLDSEFQGSGAVLSADLFGMTTTNTDDLSIGQVLEDALAHFDYVAPMVYPSHYSAGFIGISKPAEHPYEVIHHSMSEAVARVNDLSWTAKDATTTAAESASGTSTDISSATPTPPWIPGTARADAVNALSAENKREISTSQLRPWIQDFDVGAEYTPEMVRAQIQATYDVGLDSWMLWDPSNTYTREALEPATSTSQQ